MPILSCYSNNETQLLSQDTTANIGHRFSIQMMRLCVDTILGTAEIIIFTGPLEQSG